MKRTGIHFRDSGGIVWARSIVRRGHRFLVACTRVPSGERFTLGFSVTSVKYLPLELRKAVKERLDV